MTINSDKLICFLQSVTVVLLLIGLAGSASATETCPKERGENQNMDKDSCPTYTFHWENDALTGTDRYYTNGIQWAKLWKTKGEVENSPRWARRFHERLLDRVERKKALSFYRGVAFTSVFYTPEDITVRRLIPDQRPYAGWSLASSILEVLHSKGDDKGSQHRLEASVGIIGELAFGGPQQAFAHTFLSPSSDDPKGWNNQLDTEPTLQLFYKYRRLSKRLRYGELGKIYFDLTPSLTATAGNAFVWGGAGLTARLGFNLPATYADGIRPVAADASLIDGHSLYAFLNVEGRAVARNIFLDGNTFTSSHSVDKKVLVSDWSVGASFRCGRYTFTYLALTRTPEFDLQDDRQSWGSVSLAISPKSNIRFCIQPKKGGS